MLNYLTENTSVELICFFTALVFLVSEKDIAWLGMIVYLFIMCSAEFSAIYLIKKHHYNQWPYNISIVFEASFISLMFNSLFNKYFKSKFVILAGLALLLCIYIYDVREHHFLLFKDITHDTLNDKTNNAMSILFSLYALYYYYLLIKDDSYINLRHSAGFWWVTGVLFFYFGSTAINFFRRELNSDLPEDITTILIWMIYCCWSYSFICRRWEIKTSVA